ncbi:MAG: tetratricopeptide repeat protein [Candidatus Hodarchaeota archaeon]
MVKSFNYPPKELISLYQKNNEFLLLWMLNNNESSTWSNLTKIINKSTLSNYLNKFLDNDFVEKLSVEINGSKNKVYCIKPKGKERFYLLSQGKKKRSLSYPPNALLRRRNYDHWIHWMVYNNNSCKWADFLEDPLSINQSSLSKSLNFLIEKKGFVKKENKEYKITKLGKLEYANMLKQYDLDRQSILEAESKRIREITKRTNEFFKKYHIKDKNIKFRYINNVLKLPYENEKIKYTFDSEENFNKVLLFLSLNHPNEFPDYISPKDFSEEYGINLTKLKFGIIRIVDDTIYSTKFFKLDVEKEKNYYFQANEKLEKMLNAIVEEHVAKSTYLLSLSETTPNETYELNLELVIEEILDEICETLFQKGLKDALKKFLPDYIHYLAYKIEKKEELKDVFDKLEGLIWQKIQTFSLNEKISQIKEKDRTYDNINEINEAIKSNPNNIELYYSKAKILINLNQNREVLAFLNTMYENFPQEEKNIQLIKAYVFKEMKNVQVGLEIINELIKKYPEDKDLINYKACWLQYLNKKEESLKLIQQLIEQEPNNALYHDTYGEILMFFKDYKKALGEFQEVIDIGKNSWFIYQTFIKMGICQNVLGNFKSANEYLNKGKEFIEKSVSDSDTKRKWTVIANLILSEIEQLT